LKLFAPAVTIAVLVSPAAVTPGVQPRSTLFTLLSQQWCVESAEKVSAVERPVAIVPSVEEKHPPVPQVVDGAVPVLTKLVAARLVPVATPIAGVVNDMLVAVAPLGRARTPVALAVIAALPEVPPLRVSVPEVPLVPARVKLPAVVA